MGVYLHELVKAFLYYDYLEARDLLVGLGGRKRFLEYPFLYRRMEAEMGRHFYDVLWILGDRGRKIYFFIVFEVKIGQVTPENLGGFMSRDPGNRRKWLKYLGLTRGTHQSYTVRILLCPKNQLRKTRKILETHGYTNKKFTTKYYQAHPIEPFQEKALQKLQKELDNMKHD